MDKFERVYQLHSILAGRKAPISLDDLMHWLECSKVPVSELAEKRRVSGVTIYA